MRDQHLTYFGTQHRQMLKALMEHISWMLLIASHFGQL